MSSTTKPTAPMGDFTDIALGRRWVLRQIRNWLLIAFMLAAVIEFVGAPYLRWEYHYLGPHKDPFITDATYVGFTGPFRVRAGQYAKDCPLILLIKPEPSLRQRLQNQFP